MKHPKTSQERKRQNLVPVKNPKNLPHQSANLSIGGKAWIKKLISSRQQPTVKSEDRF